jgi:sigma-B regulation protein RsbU (phosphoserine phosphatase)
MADANTHDEVAALRRIIEITGLLNSTLDLDDLLHTIMTSAAELLDAETSSLLLVDEESGDLNFATATGESGQKIERRQVPAHKGIAGWVVDNGEATIIDSPKDDSRFFEVMDQAIKFETRNMVAVPLRVRGETIGVVEVINKSDGSFSESDRDLAQALANQAAIAIDNARLYAKLADAVVASRMSYRL